MTQNIPPDRMIDPAPLGRMYPTGQPSTTPPDVDPSTDYTAHLAQSGYPDTYETGQAFAAGQRLAVRQGESRPALTTGGAAPGDLIAGPVDDGPVQPVTVVGPQPRNRL